MFHLSVASRCVQKIIRGIERGDGKGEDLRRGIRPQETSHYIFFTIMEKFLMVMVEVDIGLIPDPPPLIQVRLVDCWSFLFMVIREVDIGLRQATIINTTMEYYTL